MSVPLYVYAGTCGSTSLGLPQADGLGLRGEGQLVVDVAAGTVTVRGGVKPGQRFSTRLPYHLRTTGPGRLFGMMTSNPDDDRRLTFPLTDVRDVRRDGNAVAFDVTHEDVRRTARFEATTGAHADEIATLLRGEALPEGIAAATAEGHEGRVTRVTLARPVTGRAKPDPVFLANVDRPVRAWRFPAETEPWRGSIDFKLVPAWDKAAAKMSRF